MWPPLSFMHLVTKQSVMLIYWFLFFGNDIYNQITLEYYILKDVLPREPFEYIDL